MKPVLAIAAVAVALGVTAGVAAPPTSATERVTAAAAQDAMHHAAVVVDTGDGVVRKLCLAFPEAELSGIEALRRVDTRPSRFETFSGKGSGVCMLCGVGCASGDCFCDPERFWAYHRSGPGESQYRVSALGASSTTVRDGDVEAWRWGSGGPPPKTTVSEVCGVPEPPARTTSATTTTSESPTTTGAQAPTTSAPSPPPTTPPTSVPSAPSPAAAPTTPPTARVTDPPHDGATEAPAEAGSPGEAAETAIEPVAGGRRAEDPPAATAKSGESRNIGQIASLGAFTALLGALLVWRSRIRRANVRRVRPVR